MHKIVLSLLVALFMMGCSSSSLGFTAAPSLGVSEQTNINDTTATIEMTSIQAKTTSTQKFILPTKRITPTPGITRKNSNDSILTIFQKYGKPDEVFFEVCGDCYELGNSGSFYFIYLYYSSQGLWTVADFQHETLVKIKNEANTRICQNNFETLGLGLAFIGADKSKRYDQPRKVYRVNWVIKPIEEATDMDLETFYNKVLEGDENFCINLPNNEWMP